MDWNVIIVAFVILFFVTRYLYTSLTASFIVAFLVYQWKSNAD